jgi:hypothetical protein
MPAGPSATVFAPRRRPLAWDVVAPLQTAITARLAPGEAVTILVQAMNRTTSAHTLHLLSQNISAVATARDMPQVREAAARLRQSLKKMTYPYDGPPLALGLAALLCRDRCGLGQLQPSPSRTQPTTRPSSMSPGAANPSCTCRKVPRQIVDLNATIY